LSTSLIIFTVFIDPTVTLIDLTTTLISPTVTLVGPAITLVDPIVTLSIMADLIGWCFVFWAS